MKKRRAMTAATLSLLTLVFSYSEAAAVLYRIDPSYTQIGFVVGNMWGAFHTTGMFARFSGTLVLDFAAPQNDRVDVTTESASISTGWDEANRMLVSADYLDPAHYPSVRFISDRIEPLGRDHAVIHGHLTLRGITRPLDLDARLKGRHDQPGYGPVADFIVTGELKRSDFGMTADYPLVDEDVSLEIRAHIRLTARDADAR